MATASFEGSSTDHVADVERVWADVDVDPFSPEDKKKRGFWVSLARLGDQTGPDGGFLTWGDPDV